MGATTSFVGAAGTKYNVKVQANGTGNYADSSYSESASIYIPIPLTGLTLSTDSPIVGSTITASLTPSDATANYQWYCGSEVITNATGNSFTVTEAQIGQTITCVATGIGDYSGSVSATTAVVPKLPLGTPTAPTLTAEGTTITVSWSTVTNASSYTVGYQIDGSDSWSVLTTTGATAVSLIGLPGSKYAFRVKAIGEGSYSDSDYSTIQTITITEVLTSQNDFVKTMLNTPVVIDYRANDEATDWSVTMVQFGEALYGEYVVNDDGTITYTPENGFYGTDLISYDLISPSGKLSPSFISISVGLPIATSVQKTSGTHTPTTSMAPSVDSLTEWDSCYIELWAQGVNELSAGETTITMSYNPAVFVAPTFVACTDGTVLSVSQGVELPDGSVQVELTVSTTQTIVSQTDNLFLGTVVLTPSMEEGAGIADLQASESICSLDGVNLTTTVETMSYDLTHSGKVDVDDFVAFATVFGLKPGNMSPDHSLYALAVKADFNKDGVINVDDFIAFATSFGASKAAAVKPVVQPCATPDLAIQEDNSTQPVIVEEVAVVEPLTFESLPVSIPASDVGFNTPHPLHEAYSTALLDLYDNQNESSAPALLSAKVVDELIDFDDDDAFGYLFDKSGSNDDGSNVDLSVVLDELEIELG